MTTPQVWIGCLATYNAGENFGQWLEMDDYADLEEFETAVTEMLAKATTQMAGHHFPGWIAEEWHVCDHEGFSPFGVARYESLGDIFTKATALLADNTAALLAACQAIGANVVLEGLTDSDTFASDRVRGPFEFKGDLALERHGHEIPENLHSYVDWDEMEEDYHGNEGLTRVEIDREFYFVDCTQ